MKNKTFFHDDQHLLNRRNLSKFEMLCPADCLWFPDFMRAAMTSLVPCFNAYHRTLKNTVLQKSDQQNVLQPQRPTRGQ